jgi:hypothetical protein
VTFTVGDDIRTPGGLDAVVVAVDDPSAGYVKVDVAGEKMSYPARALELTQQLQQPSVAVEPVQPLDELARLGTWLALAESGGGSEKERGAAAALRFYFARELGLPPLAAAEVSVIRGRLTIGAKLLRALAARQGYRVLRDATSDQTQCTAVLVRSSTGEEVGRYTFTIDQAKKAGLVKPNSAWENYPERMLWQRASKFVLDDYAPEVTLGIWSDDEAAEITTVEPADDWTGYDEELVAEP